MIETDRYKLTSIISRASVAQYLLDVVEDKVAPSVSFPMIRNA